MFLSLISLIACVDLPLSAPVGPPGERGDTPSGAIPQLDALDAARVSASGDDWGAAAASGVAQVTEADGTYTLSVGELRVEIDSPSVDLTRLDGTELLAESAALAWEGWPRGLVLSDSDGPVYVADGGFDLAQSEARFGAGVIAFGEVAGSWSDGAWSWVARELVVQTDDGPVALLPGEIAAVDLGGERWQITAVAVFERTPEVEDLPDCPLIEEMLSYEMIRLEDASDDWIEPPVDANPTAGSCL